MPSSAEANRAELLRGTVNLIILQALSTMSPQRLAGLVEALLVREK
jgi:hypothetical protein